MMTPQQIAAGSIMAGLAIFCILAAAGLAREGLQTDGVVVFVLFAAAFLLAGIYLWRYRQ